MVDRAKRTSIATLFLSTLVDFERRVVESATHVRRGVHRIVVRKDWMKSVEVMGSYICHLS